MTKQQQMDLDTLCNLVKESVDTIKAHVARGDELSAMRETVYLERTIDNLKRCLRNQDRIYEASIDFIRKKV